MKDICLGMTDVRLPVTQDYEWSVGPMDVSLAAGELLAILCDHRQRWPIWVSVALGLVAPDSGVVTLMGQEWQRLSPDDAAQLRGRVGRVFRHQAWLSNLDMDENVTLSVRHHSGRSPGDIHDEALELAARFGWSALPISRPAWTTHHDLQVAQWIRAFLGKPGVVLLEEPLADVTADEGQALIEYIREYRRGGGAVVWMTQDEKNFTNASLDSSSTVRIERDRWERVQ